MSTEAEANLPILEVGDEEKTTVGNYFVANYPPFSFWNTDDVSAVHDVLQAPPSSAGDAPLGLYTHIPFCRKRCDFCYFRVYTDKNAKEIQRYMDSAIDEMRRYAEQPYIKDRPLKFVYFGGGTPSYLSHKQLQYLFTGLQSHLSWDGAEEIAFECEPGTLQEKKIKALRDLGVTRLSLGVENFDPEILELNNRAHRAKEIFRAYGYAREVGFPQINIDLIAGMVGETDENWQFCIEETLKLAPESVTIYQMEIPYNTTIYKQMKDGSTKLAPVADWETKRRWVNEAFSTLEKNDYHIGSAYTAIKKDAGVEFLYRDALWTGADMLGIGVSSFSHLGGIHFQNEHNFDPYLNAIENKGADHLPIHRALKVDSEEAMIREFVLQMKLGSIDVEYFKKKFDVDVTSRFESQLTQHRDNSFLSFDKNNIELNRTGLLQVDRLLPEFFLEKHRMARYA